MKYKDRAVGTIRADLFVDGKFVVEVLARPGDVSPGDRSLVRAQLRASDLMLGLIINFAERRLKDGLVRVLNIEKLEREKGIAPAEHEEDDAGRAVNFDESH